MAGMRLVSPEEINEHKDTFSRPKIRVLLETAGFDRVETGYFEMGLNLWARATK
ncbi:MAG: hypothetical protein ACYDEQ_12275 [Desulfocucumaceae bacterium]